MVEQVLKLICEADFHPFNLLIEQANGSKSPRMMITGPYIVTEQKNANGRVYFRDVMKEAVRAYNEEYIKQSRSLGEMNHPETTEVNPDRACHLITELIEDGDSFVGKSQVLLGTPMGDLFAGLLNNGVKVGMSSRGVGSVNDKKEVTVYKLVSVDSVWNPSAPGAFVEGILESKNFMLDSHGEIVETAFDKFQGAVGGVLPAHSQDRDEVLRMAVKAFIDSIGKGTNRF